jgi:hypothetical protein
MRQATFSSSPKFAASLRIFGTNSFAPCACSTDLTEGVRASARALVSTEQSLRKGASLASKAVTGYVLPQARGEQRLQRIRHPLSCRCVWFRVWADVMGPPFHCR